MMTRKKAQPAATPPAPVPIDGRWLRYMLDQLNEEPGGGGRFEQLALALIHRRKAANIKPATPPSSGGDLGVDGRTTKTLLTHEPMFRLYKTPPEANERWIFAFSIESKWRQKLEADLATIRANRLGPSRVVFVTNRRIHPERVKITAERELKKKYHVAVEILDGSWIEHHLLSDDYHLAVMHLNAPPISDPELEAFAKRVGGFKQTGFSEAEALEIERLERSIQYVNRSIDPPEHFFRDTKLLAGLLATQETSFPRALEWYRLAWERARQAGPSPAAMAVSYAYLRALVRDKLLHEEMLVGIDQYVNMVIASNIPYHARGCANLILHLAPTMGSDARWCSALERLHAWCRSASERSYGVASLGQAADAALILDLAAITQKQDRAAYTGFFKALASHLATYQSVQSVPLEHWAKALSEAAAVFSGEEAFEAAYDLAAQIVREREGDLAVAVVSRDRAMALYRAGRYGDAVPFASRAQRAWLSPNYFRGFALTGLLIGELFRKLERPFAARAALFQVWHVTTADPQHRDLDLLRFVCLGLYECAVMVGWWREGFRWLRTYYRMCAVARVEPAPEMAATVHFVVPILLAGLRRVAPSIHDEVLVEAQQAFPDAALIHQEITLATDAEFERWLDDPGFAPPQRDELRARRATMRAGLLPVKPPPTDESAPIQLFESRWPHALGGSLLQIAVPNDPPALAFALDVAAQFEAWLTLGTERNLCVVDDPVRIEIGYTDGYTDATDELTFKDGPNGLFMVTLAREQLERAQESVTGHAFNNALAVLVATVIGASLDDPQAIFDAFKLDHFTKVREAIAAAAPPSYIAVSVLNVWRSDDTH